VALNFDRLDARKAIVLPRPPVPTEKFPFKGILCTADDQQKLGDVRGLFFKGLEKGDPTWRGQIRFENPPTRILRAGDNASLHRAGFDPLNIVVMDASGQTLGFRCCASGSPLIPATSAATERA
jgi:hypothetical protein